MRSDASTKKGPKQKNSFPSQYIRKNKQKYIYIYTVIYIYISPRNILNSWAWIRLLDQAVFNNVSPFNVPSEHTNKATRPQGMCKHDNVAKHIK